MTYCGGFTNYWLDCSREDGRVFIDNLDNYGEGYTFETLAPSLEAWLTDWLDQPWPALRFSDLENGAPWPTTMVP